MSQPSIFINAFESEKISAKELEEYVTLNFDLTPSGIISNLDLLQPNYFKTAAYGHFGRENQEFSWEKIKEL